MKYPSFNTGKKFEFSLSCEHLHKRQQE